MKVKLVFLLQVVYQLQDIFNLLPDVRLANFVQSMHISTNDQMLVVYLASLIRSIVALHNLIDNKLQNRDAEKSESKDPKKDSSRKDDNIRKTELTDAFSTKSHK